MATPETIGHADCGHCRGRVAVKKNRDGRGYYNCDHCGFKGEHMWRRTSDSFCRQFSAAEDEKTAPENPEISNQPAKPAGLKTLLG